MQRGLGASQQLSSPQGELDTLVSLEVALGVAIFLSFQQHQRNGRLCVGSASILLASGHVFKTWIRALMINLY